jgi:hypothetical protein
MIREALARHGFVSGGTGGIVGARAFVDYIVYEVAIGGGAWTETEIPDGLPWGPGWTGTYRRTDQATVIATDSSGACDVKLRLDFQPTTLAIAVQQDSCGDSDLLAQVAIYEAAPFRRVDGPGALQPTLQPTAPPATLPTPAIASTSRQRMTERPVGTVAGAPLGYIEYLPPGYGEGGPSPLLVALHGVGQSGPGDGSSLSRLFELGIPLLIKGNRWPDSRPFVVLAPQHNAVVPAVCITPTEIADFLAFAVKHYEIDPARVYLTGLSCGAIGSWNYLGAHPDEVVAAAVLISGGGYGAIDEGGCGVGRVPIWAFHGVKDDVVPARYSINSIARLQQCSDPTAVDARLTLYSDAGHDAWSRTYDLSAGYDIYSWLLGYTK